MKRLALAIAMIASLAGCEGPAQPNPTVEEQPVVVDEECPRADGEACR